MFLGRRSLHYERLHYKYSEPLLLVRGLEEYCGNSRLNSSWGCAIISTIHVYSCLRAFLLLFVTLLFLLTAGEEAMEVQNLQPLENGAAGPAEVCGVGGSSVLDSFGILPDVMDGDGKATHRLSQDSG